MKTPRTFWLIPALLAAALAGCQNAPPSAPPSEMKLGVQAYTFRRFTFAETLDKVQTLGIHYLQAFPFQNLGGGLPGKFNYPMDDATRAAVRALIQSKGIEVVSYGVVTGKNPQEWRKIFEFAKAMGLQNITSEPPQEDMPLVDQLSREFGITVALHNHPKPNRYANPADSMAAIKPYGPNIGLCADTGHWVRNGYDPVAALRMAEGRILYLHFKDLNEFGTKAGHDVPWGTGISNAAGQIAELRRQGFSGIVFAEYEYDTPTLESNVARSAEYFRRALKAPMADLIAGRVVPPGFTRDATQVWDGDRGKDSRRWPVSQPLIKPGDLSDVTVASGAWAWRDDVLSAPAGGTLWTKDSYGDFILMAEIRCSEKPRGAIFIRAGDPSDPTSKSIKLELGGRRPGGGSDAAGPYTLPKVKQAPSLKPGQWTQLVITAHGGQINVTLDHKDIVKLNLDKLTKAATPADDTTTPLLSPDAASAPPSDLPRSGQIGLQSEGTPIEFRQVLLDRL